MKTFIVKYSYRNQRYAVRVMNHSLIGAACMVKGYVYSVKEVKM